MRESEYMECTPLKHRKRYGQFFTPIPVARLMTKWVLRGNPRTILDPAYGLGVFYDEIMKLRANDSISVTGYEVDTHILEYLYPNEIRPNLKLYNCDYLESDVGKFDGIVCNPPYMRFQKFLNRHDVLPSIEEKLGKKLVGHSNISSVFLVKSLEELNPGGNLAYIMPFEFFNANYGREIKKSLLENHLLKQIIIFSNERDIFPDAITTVCVLLCMNDSQKSSIGLTIIKDIEELNQVSNDGILVNKEIDPAELPYKEKWTPIIRSFFKEIQPPVGFCKLSSYGSVVRGIATGANEFFGLTKSKIEDRGLKECHICKCITKSSQIRKLVFTDNDFQCLYMANKPVYCLDVRERLNETVRSYIEEGERSGFHTRYLTRTRKLWYQIEYRKPAPILFGVFNRGRIKIIRNFTSAINFTCFHAFYPNLFGQLIIDKLFVYLISDIGQEILKINKRSYGNTLDKFEPGDLNNSYCPSQRQFDLIDDESAQRVINLAMTDEKAAIDLSNKLVQSSIQSSPLRRESEILIKSIHANNQQEPHEN